MIPESVFYVLEKMFVDDERTFVFSILNRKDRTNFERTLKRTVSKLLKQIFKIKSF